MKIQIISVGGTIDKVYFDKLSNYQVGGPSIRNVFDHLVLNMDYDIRSLIKKDSLDMTDEDRKRIRDEVANDPCDRILITHGTDRMIRTAEELAGIEGKVIVLTGAMQPAGFKTSDAVFNVGCAIGAIQSLDPGVYIAINGRIYRPDQIRKNREEGRFEEIDSTDQNLASSGSR